MVAITTWREFMIVLVDIAVLESVGGNDDDEDNDENACDNGRMLLFALMPLLRDADASAARIEPLVALSLMQCLHRSR